MKDEQLEKALGCLAQRFRVICDSEQPSDKTLIDYVVKHVNYSDLASKLNSTFSRVRCVFFFVKDVVSILWHTHGPEVISVMWE